jgi:hypothetical protein
MSDLRPEGHQVPVSAEIERQRPPSGSRAYRVRDLQWKDDALDIITETSRGAKS